MFVTIASRKDPDLGLLCLSRPFLLATGVRNFKTFIIYTEGLKNHCTLKLQWLRTVPVDACCIHVRPCKPSLGLRGSTLMQCSQTGITHSMCVMEWVTPGMQFNRMPSVTPRLGLNNILFR